MGRTEEVLDAMIKYQQKGSIRFVLQADTREITLSDCRIYRFSASVRSTDRGDARLSGAPAYKIVGSSHDLSIVSLLPRVMLGPSTEFAKLKITAEFPPDSVGRTIMYGHLTNSMQNLSLIQLHIVVDEVA